MELVVSFARYAFVLTAPAICFSATFPSDSDLVQHYQHHSADFDSLGKMISEDHNMVRIASDFLWTMDHVSYETKEDKKYIADHGISDERWVKYKKLFQRVAAKHGLTIWPEKGVVFID